MKTLIDLKAYLVDIDKLLNADNLVSADDAEIRAVKFLQAQLEIAATIHALDSELFKLDSLRAAVWANVLLNDANKTVDKAKASAEAHPDYIDSQEKYAKIKADLEFLKKLDRIYENAHVFYRQKNKGDRNGNL